MKVYFDTMGCPKNFTDTEMAASCIEDSGHVVVDSPEESDVIVVNTCGFIEDAKKESIHEIFDMLGYKEQGKKLIVSGCLVQRYAEELFKEMPEVDAFIGVNDYDRLGSIVDDMFAPGYTRLRLNSHNSEGAFTGKRSMRKVSHTAYLRIAEGCDNVCTYCIIPKIRGPYRSRREEEILEEAKELAANGCKELILIAQDTTCYGLDLYGSLKLPELLKKLCRIEGIRWIRLMYCYDDKITDELIDTIRTEEKICNYIDIPLQHASDRILSSMNRTSTSREIETKLDKLRAAIPDIHIRTTLIVGFPGETEEDHRILCDFISRRRFARLGAFAYSREEDTPAYDFPEQVDEETKQRRLDEIMMEQMEISLSLNKEKIGKTYDVLIDETEEDGTLVGRTMYDAPEIDNSVLFTSPYPRSPGDMVKVEITDAFDYDLTGREVTDESAK